MARILAKALNCAQGPTPTPDNTCHVCVGDHERQLARRDRDGRRLAARDRRHPRDPRARRAPARRGPLQGLHPRRGAPAHGRRLERAPEADRGASAPPRLRLLHDRPLEGAPDRPLALPDLRLLAAAAARPRPQAAPDRRRREDRRARRGARADRALARAALPRRRVDARPALGGDGRERSPCRPCCSSSARSRRRRCSGSATSSSTATRPARSTFIEELSEQGQDLGRLVTDLLEHLRHLLLVQHMGEVPDSLPVTEETRERLRAQANQLGEAPVLRLIDLLPSRSTTCARAAIRACRSSSRSSR